MYCRSAKVLGSLNSHGKAKGKEREMNGLALSQVMLATYRSGDLIKEKESRFGIQSSLFWNGKIPLKRMISKLEKRKRVVS